MESNHAHAKVASEALDGRNNVLLTMGDSSVGLLHMINRNKDKKIMIFLDAHWYKNPVLKELDQIAKSGIKPVLAIHDFKNPHDPTMGYDVYPNEGIVYEFDWIQSKLIDIYGAGEYRYFYNEKAAGARRGCLFVAPR
jgi:hypothetical protein